MEGLLTLVTTIVMLVLTKWTCGNQRQREGKNVISHESFQEMTVCKGQGVTVNIWPNVSCIEDLIGHPPSDSRGRNLRGQCAYVFSGQDLRPFVIFTYSLSGLRFEIISPSVKFGDKFPWLLTLYSIDKLDSRYITCTVQNGSSKAWKTNFNFVVTDMKSPLLTSNRITMKTLLRNNVMTVECSLKPPVSSGYPPIHLALRGPYGELIENSKLPTLLSTLPDGYLAGRYSCVLEGQAMACISPRLAGSQLNASIHIESILPRPVIEHPPFLIGRDDGRVNCTVILNQFAAADLGSGHPLTWDINGLPQKNLGSIRRWRFIPEGRVGVLQYVSELFLGTVGIIHIEQNITCTVRVGLKTSASSWIVQVVFPPLPPTIVGPDSVLIGDVTQFRCIAEGASLVAPTINWDDSSGRHLQDMTHSSYVTYQEKSQWKASQYDSKRLWTPETLNNGRQLRLKRSWNKRPSVLTTNGFQRSSSSPRNLYDATTIIKRVRNRWKAGVSASVQVFSSSNNSRNRTGNKHKLYFLPSRVQADVEPGTIITPWKFVTKNTLENSEFSIESTTPNGEGTKEQETKTRKDRRTVSRARGAKRKDHKSAGKDTTFFTEQNLRAVKLESVAQTDLFTRTDSPEGHRSKRASSEVKDTTRMPIESNKDGEGIEITARVSRSTRFASSGSEDDNSWLFGGDNFEDEENNKNKERTHGKPMGSVYKEPGSVTTWKRGNDEKVKGSQHDFSRKNKMFPLYTENNISASNDGQNKGGYIGADYRMIRDVLANRLNASSTQTERHTNSDGRKSGLEDEGPDGSFPDKKHKATTMYRVVSVLDFLPLPEARVAELKCMVHHLTLTEKIIAIKKVYITDPPFEPVILGPNEMLQGENATWTCLSKGPSSSPPTIKWSDNQSRDLTPLSSTSSTTFLGEDGRLWHNVTSRLTYSPDWQERDIKLRCTATFSIITISVSGMINISVKDESSSLSEKLGSADVTGSTHTQAETSSGENLSAPRLHPDTFYGSGTETLVNSVPNDEQEPNASMHTSPEEQSLMYSMSKTRRYLLESTSNTGDNGNRVNEPREASENNSTRSTNTDDNNNLVDKHSMEVSGNNSVRSTSNTSNNGILVDKHGMEVSGHNSVRSKSSQERNNLDYSGGRANASDIPPTKADNLNRSSDNTSEKNILKPSNLKGLLETLHTREKTLPIWKRHEFLSNNTTSVGNVTKTIEMDTDSNIASETDPRESLKPLDDDKTANFNTSYSDTKVFSPAESEVSNSQEVMNSFRKGGKTLQTNRNKSLEKKLFTAGNSTSNNTHTLNTLSNEAQVRRHNVVSAHISRNISNPSSYKVNFTQSNPEKNVFSDLGVENYEEGSKVRNVRHPSGLNDKVNSSVAMSSGKLNLTSQENTLSPKHTDLEVGVEHVHETSNSKYPVVKNTRKQDRNDRANFSDDSRSERLNLTSSTKSPEVAELGLQDYDVNNKATTTHAERAKKDSRSLKNNGINTSVNVRSAPNWTSWANSSNPGNILDSKLGVNNYEEKNKTRNQLFENNKQRPNNLKAENGVNSSVISRNDAQNRTSQPVTAGHSTSQPIKTSSKDEELGNGVFDVKVSLATPKHLVSEVSFPPSNRMMQGNGENDWPAQVPPRVTESYDDHDTSSNLKKPSSAGDNAASQNFYADVQSDKMMFAAGFASVFIVLVLVSLLVLWFQSRLRHNDPTDGY